MTKERFLDSFDSVGQFYSHPFIRNINYYTVSCIIVQCALYSDTALGFINCISFRKCHCALYRPIYPINISLDLKSSLYSFHWYLASVQQKIEIRSLVEYHISNGARSDDEIPFRVYVHESPFTTSKHFPWGIFIASSWTNPTQLGFELHITKHDKYGVSWKGSTFQSDNRLALILITWINFDATMDK